MKKTFKIMALMFLGMVSFPLLACSSYILYDSCIWLSIALMPCSIMAPALFFMQAMELDKN